MRETVVMRKKLSRNLLNVSKLSEKYINTYK